MRRFLLIGIALIATCAMVTTTVAQSPEASPSAEMYPGLIEGVTRQYTPDPTKALTDDPDAFVLISIHLFRFDTREHANETWTRLADTSPVPTGNGAGSVATPDLHDETVDNLGDQARVAWFAATNSAGDTGYYRTLTVQDGEYLIIANAISGSKDNALLADELVRAVIDREASGNAVEFSADGTSIGGIWGKLPLTGDKDAQGLTAFSDREIDIP